MAGEGTAKREEVTEHRRILYAIVRILLKYPIIQLHRLETESYNG